jgi:hypothetical protein
MQKVKGVCRVGFTLNYLRRFIFLFEHIGTFKF